MNNETTVHVVWEGPITVADVAALCGPADHGVYAIYGPHNVYGLSPLLYIGRANERTFGVRIPEHRWAEFERSAEISIHVGRLAHPPGQEAAGINDVEGLLIYAHGPAYNSSCIQDPPPTGAVRHLRILNWGSYRSLLPEVSGLRWFTRHQDIRALLHP